MRLAVVFSILCLCVTSSAAPAKIAFISAASGSDPNTALELKRGLDIYLKQVPQAAKRMEVAAFDNKGDLRETVSIVEQAAKQKTVAVIGIARSDEAIAAAQIAKERGLVFLTPFATNPRLKDIDFKTVQVCYADDFQGHALAKLVHDELKPKRILALVNSESLYSTGLAKTFFDESALLKGIVVDRVDYTEKDLKKEKIVELANLAKPDLIFIPDHITRAAVFAKLLNRPGVRFLGGDGFGGKKILTGVFGDTPNIELYYSTHWHPDIKTPQNQVFIRGYKSMFPSSEPTSGAAMMFDLMGMLDNALKNGATTSEDIAKAIRGHSFDTTTGKLEIPTKLEGAKKPVVILQLKDNRYGFYKTYR